MENKRRRRQSPKPMQPRKPVLIAAAAAVAVALIIILIYCLNLKLDIRLNGGDAPIVVVHGKDTYQEQGATATVNGKVVDVTIEGEVDHMKLGVYKLTYRAEYLWLSASVQREVHVVDSTAPIIILNEDPEHFTKPGEPYEEEGFTAVDDYDGDITDKVESYEQNGKVIYQVTDSSGNETTVVRQIKYADIVAPEIVLKGDSSITIKAGNTYTEPGYTATDNVDGDITARVQIEGTVDTYRAGTYKLVYKVTDSFGNTAEATRTVIVKPIQQSDIVKPDGKVIYLTFDDGPGVHTQRLLDILAKYNVKATFFVVNTDYYMHTLLNNIVDGGHSIGMHSVTHEYDEIYANEEAFLNDLYGMQAIIEKHTGVKSMLMRFPGGSLNANRPGLENLTKKLKDLGFRYFDWHVDSDDWKDKNTEMAVNKIIERIGNRDNVIVLQHDIYGTSVDAVEEVIIWGLQNGYTFLPLTTSSPACEQVS
ncbi:MAG: DUF5011 domain-containing protein [Ruminococcaceae bacterium]|nr:DUF5011 domain-containing protein [Oscillospiraceae bacterium]